MKSIKITLFITGAIFFAMLLGSLKATAQVPYEECARDSKSLYIDIQVYNQTEKISAGNGFIGPRLKSELSFLRMNEFSLKDKVQTLEASFARCYIELSPKEELALEMDVELFKKGTKKSAADEQE